MVANVFGNQAIMFLRQNQAKVTYSGASCLIEYKMVRNVYQQVCTTLRAPNHQENKRVRVCFVKERQVCCVCDDDTVIECPLAWAGGSSSHLLYWNDNQLAREATEGPQVTSAMMCCMLATLGPPMYEALRHAHEWSA